MNATEWGLEVTCVLPEMCSQRITKCTGFCLLPSGWKEDGAGIQTVQREWGEAQGEQTMKIRTPDLGDVGQLDYMNSQFCEEVNHFPLTCNTDKFFCHTQLNTFLLLYLYIIKYFFIVLNFAYQFVVKKQEPKLQLLALLLKLIKLLHYWWCTQF